MNLIQAFMMLALAAAPATPGASPTKKNPAATQPAPRAPRPLPKPEYLPEEARDVLRDRMARHGADMTVLMATVLMLDHELAAELAHNIATEPRLARPRAGDSDAVNALLPPRFFDLQDQLKTRASEVVTAAHQRDDARLVKAYGRLAETCVACHSTYFRGSVPPGFE